MSANRLFVVALLTTALASPASAQGLRPSTRPAPATWYASVTLANPSDIAVECKINWPTATPTLITLAPGARTTLRTSFLSGSAEPKLTVVFETGVGSPHGISTADYRAGFDTRDTNIGRVYDFGHYLSNGGDILTLTPR
jgi:hypothetical protein